MVESAGAGVPQVLVGWLTPQNVTLLFNRKLQLSAKVNGYIIVDTFKNYHLNCAILKKLRKLELQTNFWKT